jgi:hypothetical protein
MVMMACTMVTDVFVATILFLSVTAYRASVTPDIKSPARMKRTDLRLEIMTMKRVYKAPCDGDCFNCVHSDCICPDCINFVVKDKIPTERKYVQSKDLLKES